jgi:peptidylprolyl isomerase
MRRLLALLTALLLAAGVAACGSDDGSSSDSGSSADSTPTQTATAAPTETAAPSGGALDDLSKKPAIPKPSGKAPTKLVIKDIVKGKGIKAKAGEAVTVQYVGVSYDTGKEFDASWDRGQPFTFQLGAQQVIPGWDQGVAGMRVGGRRELTIPPDLAYGAQGSPPAIQPNETLIFVVDLKRIG